MKPPEVPCVAEIRQNVFLPSILTCRGGGREGVVGEAERKVSALSFVDIHCLRVRSIGCSIADMNDEAPTSK